jgi:hypothetical protein
VTHPYLIGTPRPRVFAHRGLVPVDVPEIAENSFAAVAAAHAAGAVYVESDCHLTRDGVVVLFHDDDLSRVTGDPRLVRDVTERELADLMAHRGGLIGFEQALDAFPGVRFNIDVKADAAAPGSAARRRSPQPTPIGRVRAPRRPRAPRSWRRSRRPRRWAPRRSSANSSWASTRCRSPSARGPYRWSHRGSSGQRTAPERRSTSGP